MACACSGVGSRGEVLLINEFWREKKAVGGLTKEEADMFWTESVPCGCSLASDLRDSEAGAPIVVF